MVHLSISYHFQNMLTVLLTTRMLYIQIHRTSLEPDRISLESISALHAHRSWRRERKLRTKWSQLQLVGKRYYIYMWEHFEFSVQYDDEDKKTVNKQSRVSTPCFATGGYWSGNGSSMMSHLCDVLSLGKKKNNLSLLPSNKNLWKKRNCKGTQRTQTFFVWAC